MTYLQLHPPSLSGYYYYGASFISLLYLLFPYFEKTQIGLWDHLALWLSVCVSPHQFSNAWTNLYETWFAYHGTWAHLNGAFLKSLPSVCVSVCVSPLAFLGNGSVYTLPRKRIHETKKKCWTRRFICGPCGVKGKSVGLSVYPTIVAKQRLGKHVPAATKVCSRRRFLCGTCRIKGK
jgi:hypothetical protein